MPTVQDFRDYIRQTKLKSADQGLQMVRLDAEGIHICVAGPSRGFADMSSCREAMEAERGPNDQIVADEDKRNNLVIDYEV